MKLSANKIALTILSLLISFTIAGYGSEIGLLIRPMASAFNVEITDAAAQFSFFLGGILVGNLFAFQVYRYVSIRYALIACFSIATTAVFGMHIMQVFSLNAVFLSILGIAYGVGSCGASTIVAKIWSERHRQSVFVAQDAVFNAGGMFFPPVAAYFLARQFDWSIGYLSVACVAILILLLAIFCPINISHEEENKSSKLEWDVGLTVAGLALFCALICKLAPIIWLPVFVQETNGVSEQVSATIIPKIYMAGLIGSLLSVAVVARLGVQPFIISVVILGLAATSLLTLDLSFDQITVVAYLYGFAIAALYHSFMVWGLSYIRNPSFQHVSFMYVCGGVGGTIAPYATSKIVEYFDIATVFAVCSVLYVVILALFAFLYLFKKRTPPLRAENS